MENTCSGKENSNSQTTSSKSVKAILSKEDLKGTRIEHGFKRAFMPLFGQDADFTSTMLLNVDQLQKQLDKDKFQEDGSMEEGSMASLLTKESKINTCKAVDVDLVVIESSGTESEVQDDSSGCVVRKDRNSKTSVMPSARFQSTADGSKPKPRSTNHSTRSLPVFKSKHRFFLNKTSVVYEKTSPRSDLRWKPTGRIFKTVGLRWVPMGKILASCTRKDDSEPTHGSNVDIPNIHKCKQTLDLSACTSINVQKEQSFDLSAVVSMSSNVPTADASDKCQQQPDSTSSTSTLATTVTADGNFDLLMKGMYEFYDILLNVLCPRGMEKVASLGIDARNCSLFVVLVIVSEASVFDNADPRNWDVKLLYSDATVLGGHCALHTVHATQLSYLILLHLLHRKMSTVSVVLEAGCLDVFHLDIEDFLIDQVFSFDLAIDFDSLHSMYQLGVALKSHNTETSRLNENNTVMIKR
ncbi:hypothetical protein Tco_1042090 [Tanacetum coccineum]|uniref:Uncharacterized protein n=1 Tax=Tanacetum coccineum TaxID=301880 RepID=A0ABQ5GI22_9ASTR